jgi:hypothetical protein
VRNIDSLRYSHTLSNGEELTLTMAFSKENENEDVFMARCQYMFRTMSAAIHAHELKFKIKPNVSFGSGQVTIKDPLGDN